MTSPAATDKNAATLSLGTLQSAVDETLVRLDRDKFVPRLWAKDAGLWKNEPAHQTIILNSLGWLRVAEDMEARLPELEEFANGVRKDGFTDVVLLGMGGSSLAAEVYRSWLAARPGSPRFHMLDSTDPGWVAALEGRLNLARTLFIVSSKSGTTIEPHCFTSYFWERAGKNGKHFVAVTDPGSFLERMARERGFRKVFVNPSDIGGRFSALSLFGLVPAAASGMDVRRFLAGARRMMAACGPDVPAAQNPGVVLGAVLGALAGKGRDKVTLLVPKGTEAFGLWIEQLVAESSGKEGKGIVPIAAEPLGEAARYGEDRLFVVLRVAGTEDPAVEALVRAVKPRHPVVELSVADRYDLGAEMFRWEVATATACSLLDINAFDQPNVQEAKDLAKSALKELSKGGLKEPAVQAQGRNFRVSFSKAASSSLTFGDFAKLAKAGDYFGILPFLPWDPEADKKFSALRGKLRDKTGAATLFGYGPRYLHSTGQLHKGGGNNGLFLVFTCESAGDLRVPDQDFTFGQLETAQALGDFQALDSRGRRAARVHLSGRLDESLDEFLGWVESGLEA